MKKTLVILLLLFLANFFAEKNSSAEKFSFSFFYDTAKAVDTSCAYFAKADSIVAFAKTLLGTPYKYGSCSPKGFDCSGLVYYVMKHNGVEVPRSSIEMGKFGKEIPLSECRKGDIILFKGTNANSKRIGHAALIISEEGQPVQFIQSSSSKKEWGVVISSYDESDYYCKRFVKVVRVL